MYAVILAGGKGKRFWPASRESKPKQFLDISGEGSMLKLTLRRLSGLASLEKTIILTVESQSESVRESLPDLPEENVISEPAGRNTAPALALAALVVRSRSGDEPFLVCPADHLISKRDNFTAAVNRARDIAVREDLLVTFGIEPEYPATGYGYIEAGERVDSGSGPGFFRVRRFHEKPDRPRAEEYLNREGYYWNSGMFLWRPSVYLRAWEKYFPDSKNHLEAISESVGKESFGAVLSKEYPRLPSTSVDYGILEKAENVAVTPADLEWNDVGSWDALPDVLAPDRFGNVSLGNSISLDSAGCVFYSEDGLVAAVGLEDVIIISSGNAVLVCKKGESQKVKELVELIGKKGMKDYL